MLTNWAGNHTYVASHTHRPTSVEQLQEVVAEAQRIHAVGSRHSFTDLTDSPGDLVFTGDLPAEIDVDVERSTVRVAGGVLYGHLAETVQRAGCALGNMASLPHISVTGAVSTGTHGSGSGNGSLSSTVSSVEYVSADGCLHQVSRGDADFDGHVVSLGGLGVATHLTLDLQPTFDVRQDLWTGLPWSAVDAHFGEIMDSAYSVSLFTDWVGEAVYQVWVKSRELEDRTELFGATPATETLHMIRDGEIASVTEQGGVVGPWNARLPHFRLEFTPSRGAELQSEYFVPRDRAAEAFARLRELGAAFSHLLLCGEIRTVAADRLWLSGAYDRDSVALHFTWVLDVDAVYDVMPAIEEALLPLGARPHWGKCFAATADQLRPAYPRFDDFRALAHRWDPHGKFRNAFLERNLSLTSVG